MTIRQRLEMVVLEALQKPKILLKISLFCSKKMCVYDILISENLKNTAKRMQLWKK